MAEYNSFEPEKKTLLKRQGGIFVKNLIAIVTILFLWTSPLFAQTATPPSAGDGSEGDPYRISTLDNLFWLSQNDSEWDKHYIQTADIDASGTASWDDGDGGDAEGFSPIGNESVSFSGTYDGRSHTIYGLTINRPESNIVGFFGYVYYMYDQRFIKDLMLENVNVTGYQHVGAMAGEISNYKLENCGSTGIVSGYDLVAGLVGESHSNADIVLCHSSADISASIRSAGLVGISRSDISQSYSAGNISASQSFAGLIFSNGGTLQNCYSISDLNSNSDAYDLGGLVQRNDGSITNCYSAGALDGSRDVGGLVEWNRYGEAVGSFWDTEASGYDVSDIGVGKTTAEMTDQSTFTDAGWDFDTVWAISPGINSGYPYLQSAPPPIPPLVETQSAESIEGYSATITCNLVDFGDDAPSQHGICWSGSSSPTINDARTELGQAAATGVYTSDMVGLLPETTYYVRAYATNSAGTSYGDEITVTTESIPVFIDYQIRTQRYYAETSYETFGTEPVVQVRFQIGDAYSGTGAYSSWHCKRWDGTCNNGCTTDDTSVLWTGTAMDDADNIYIGIQGWESDIENAGNEDCVYKSGDDEDYSSKESTAIDDLSANSRATWTRFADNDGYVESGSSGGDNWYRVQFYSFWNYSIPANPGFSISNVASDGFRIDLTDHNGYRITDWDYQVATDDAFSNIVASATELENGFADVTGLDPGTIHYIRIRGENEAGTGNYTDYQTQTTAMDAWSDAFPGDVAEQDWVYEDTGGSGSVVDIANDRMELFAEYPGSPFHLTGRVDFPDHDDAIISARVQDISGEHKYEAHLLLRGQADDSGYLFGITDQGELFIDKRVAGTDSMLATGTATDVDPADCMLKFAAVGNKLFGKAWTCGTSEPCAWDLEAVDNGYEAGDGGAGVGGASEDAMAAFDDIALDSDLTDFWQSSGDCGGGTLPAGGDATKTAGGSQVTLYSDSVGDAVFSIVEVADAPENASKLAGAVAIDKYLQVHCSLEDGEFTAVLQLQYTDDEIAGLEESSLRLYYYDVDSDTWPLAVDGNTEGAANWLGDSAPTQNLGDHGVDMANNILWAVVDHFTDFGAGGTGETGTGGWVLQDKNMGGSIYLMVQGDSSQAEDSLVIANGESLVWVAGAAADVDTTFQDPFGGQLMFSANPSLGSFTVEVGYYEDGGAGFVAGDTATLSMDGSQIYNMDALDIFDDGSNEPETFMVPAGQYLALRLTNNTLFEQTILTGGLRSWLNATNSDEAYPLLIELGSFTATAGEDGVDLFWHTNSEVDTAGYHIWRGTSPDDEYLRITDALIPARGDSVTEASYSYTDFDATGTGFLYELEDIGYDGVGTFHSLTARYMALSAGWNLIGGDAFAGMAVSDALSSIDGNYSSVWGLNGSGWQAHTPGQSECSDLESFEAGRGYWIFVTQGCDLHLP